MNRGGVFVGAVVASALLGGGVGLVVGAVASAPVVVSCDDAIAARSVAVVDLVNAEVAAESSGAAEDWNEYHRLESVQAYRHAVYVMSCFEAPEVRS